MARHLARHSVRARMVMVAPRGGARPLAPSPASLLVIGGAVLLLAALAHADVKQPSGVTVPSPMIGCYSGQPGGLGPIFACVCAQAGTCNIGKSCPGGSPSCDPGTNGTCETTIWHTVNDDPCIPSNISGLHPVKDANVKPETFRPVCGLNFTLVARGGAMFKNVFGWYNVDPTGKKPAANELYPLVQCNTPIGTATPLNLLSEPNYKGGDIGFFIATPESPTQKGACAKGDCCATVTRATTGEGYIYYSQPQFNPDNKGPGVSYIHLLLYASKITPYKYYFAWEDTFDGTSNDFSDFVTAVAGISCPGGGLRCDTGKPGVCNLGVSRCDSGTTTCEASVQSSPEVCDGLDNDCNGKVDDGATCPDGKKCYQGRCVADCKTSQEFACDAGFECDAALGMCVETACKTVSCKPGEICRAGKCGNGCDGVKCPGQQVCQSGLCVDLCAGRSCKAGEICKLGVCIPNCTSCGGLTCSGGLSCDKTSGDCLDPSCSPACAPSSVCKQGKCVDRCDGVVCPGGTVCTGGLCPPPGLKTKKPSTVDAGVPPWTADGSTTSGKDAASGPGFSAGKGCSCTTAPSPIESLMVIVALALALTLRRTRAYGTRRRTSGPGAR